ncbi:hypothetical protein B481_0809 [Planococcus halocryophilus Or1]|nr:hypothetical protein B481_0809 [Planococcus halocryophilus Or1]
MMSFGQYFIDLDSIQKKVDSIAIYWKKGTILMVVTSL